MQHRFAAIQYETFTPTAPPWNPHYSFPFKPVDDGFEFQKPSAPSAPLATVTYPPSYPTEGGYGFVGGYPSPSAPPPDPSYSASYSVHAPYPPAGSSAIVVPPPGTSLSNLVDFAIQKRSSDPYESARMMDRVIDDPRFTKLPPREKGICYDNATESYIAMANACFKRQDVRTAQIAYAWARHYLAVAISRDEAGPNPTPAQSRTIMNRWLRSVKIWINEGLTNELPTASFRQMHADLCTVEQSLSVSQYFYQHLRTLTLLGYLDIYLGNPEKALERAYHVHNTLATRLKHINRNPYGFDARELAMEHETILSELKTSLEWLKSVDSAYLVAPVPSLGNTPFMTLFGKVERQIAHSLSTNTKIDRAQKEELATYIGLAWLRAKEGNDIYGAEARQIIGSLDILGTHSKSQKCCTIQ